MNLSITDFQKISNGYHNAGDITLTGRGKLDMVNNHVGVLKGWNTKSVSAATTLEVKNAFVQALKNAGVDEGALEKVRAELGLPQSGSTRGFDISSLKPLTRAQTREILDRFAGVINQKAGRTVVSNRWESLQPKDISDSRYELNVDDKKNTATVTVTQNYDIKPGVGVHEGVFFEDGDRGEKLGTAQYTYQITVTGLESGSPKIASVGFGQDITAADM